MILWILRKLKFYLWVIQRTFLMFGRLLNCPKPPPDAEEVVLWVWPSAPQNLGQYLAVDTSIKDLCTWIELRRLFRVKLIFGGKIGEIHNKKVFFNYDPSFDRYRFLNHTAVVKFICDQLERQGCQVIPPYAERRFWENKAEMHRQFKHLGIREPKTFIWANADLEKLFLEQPLAFPFLIKAAHSCSSLGVYHIDSMATLHGVLSVDFLAANPEFIIQELVPMRQDLRVIFVGEKVVLHYWRKNPNPEWRPTSSQHGSQINFGNFPKMWEEEFRRTFLKFGIATGAFDITWKDDDINSAPIYLELSPTYQPNPPVDTKRWGITYGQYKKRFRIFNSYNAAMVNILFAIQQQIINEWIRVYVNQANYEKKNKDLVETKVA